VLRTPIVVSAISWKTVWLRIKTKISFNHAPQRRRKLLHRHKLVDAVEREGRTLVPLKLYFNEKGRVKLELALARGKKLYDKREVQKKRLLGARARAVDATERINSLSIPLLRTSQAVFLFAPFRSAPSKPHTSSTSVLVNKFDASSFDCFSQCHYSRKVRSHRARL